MKGQKAMPLEIVTIPCLSDNYAFLAHDATSGQTALIDAPEAAPILQALDEKGWTLSHVLLTHHHWDHVDGLSGILEKHPAQVVGAAADAHRLPSLDLQVVEGDSFEIGGEQVQVLDVSGHTVGHVAYYMPQSAAVFTADSLMALGCGRLFEGTPDQMWASLSKLAALPDDTLVCSGHEYTQSNAKFAITVDPDNPDLKARIADIERARAAGEATVPSILALEKATNPFLRAADPAIQAHLGMTGARPEAVFAEIRGRKDRF
ncbi:hydroxyacylglutathione hydrolase [Ruegeria sp. HKCCD5849]|uniref:hydroxyacylglutathione hydrolase n=2 Tax=Ruegeria TaxID=97050 RepID=UPI0019EF9068|nr:hydroxyacylglutathione hydrolase [Ruegeria sp. HKCCD5851]NOD47143.1 hydroxyacylglutathione hydrolase [Ruegeria sp. HKCCD5849]NOD51466.1 hydroxyacylglutathione hydrolase [Ruegeria sp. HKCCD5851]NOD69389.1 hydroxyacylglutathione hydrolase [Ruegeria sp. HKCCD7303]